jgi:hypothetical protein
MPSTRLEDLLRQAIKFEGQTVRDAREVRAWKYEAMAAVGGFDLDAVKAADKDHDKWFNEMFHMRNSK